MYFFMSVVASGILMVLYNEFLFPQDEIKTYNDAWFTLYIFHLIILSIIVSLLMYLIFSKLGKSASSAGKKIAAKSANRRAAEAAADAIRRAESAAVWENLRQGQELDSINPSDVPASFGYFF